MAKIQFGSGIAAISGRTAGTVFSRNKGGAYMRRFSKPTNPSSPAQDIARNRLATASAYWKTMTDAMRDAWSSYALTHPILDRLGASLNLSGHQAFVKVTANRLIMGDPIAAETPVDPEFFNPVIVVAEGEFAASNAALDLRSGCLIPAGGQFALWASPPSSPGVTNTQSQERLVKAVTVVAELEAAERITEVTGALYVAVFGDVSAAEGKSVNFSAYPYSNGVFGQRASAKLIIV
jgi:hypothetical protein